MFKLDLHRLAVFHAVVSEGSLSKAGKRLFMSQPAVSAHIKALEQQLEFPLFYREGRRSVVNKAGEVLFKKAEELFTVADDLKAEMDTLKGVENGRINLGVSLNWQYRLPIVLDRFKREFPNIELSMEVANSDRIEQLVLDRTLEIGFVSKGSTRSELECTHIAEDLLVPICSSSHRFAKMDKIDVSELSNEPKIVRESRSATRELTDAMLSAAGIENNISMELGSYEAIKSAVISGQGVGIVPMQSLGADLHTGLLTIPNVPDLKASIDLNLLHYRDRRMSPAVQKFIQLVTAEVYASNLLNPVTTMYKVNGNGRGATYPVG